MPRSMQITAAALLLFCAVAAADDPAVMARVNGKAIPMAQLEALLLKGPALRYAQELVRNELVRQAAEKKGVSCSPAEVAAETQRYLKQMFPKLKTPQERARVLKRLLADKEVSREQWDMSMRISVLVRKLVEPGVKVTAADLREEHYRRYGPKALISHIEVRSLQKAQEVRDLLTKGGSFARIAQIYSIHPSAKSGGKLPPIGANDTAVPPALRKAALGMTKPGDLSRPIQTGQTYHVIRLERKVKPRKAPPLEAVRSELSKSVRRRKLREEKQKFMWSLFSKADIDYVQPILRAKAAEVRRRAE